MKKLLASFLTVLFILSLTACDSKTVSKPQTPAKKPSVSTPSDTNSDGENIINSEPENSKNDEEITPPKSEEEQKPVITTKPEFSDFYYFYSKHMTFIDDKIYFSGEDGTYCVDKNGGTPQKVTNFFCFFISFFNKKQ